MIYTDFTPADLTQQFSLDFQAARLFTNCPPQSPSSGLLETLQRAQRIGYVSEKARSERLVSPVLTELNELNQQHFTFHSGVNPDVDAARRPHPYQASGSRRYAKKDGFWLTGGRFGGPLSGRCSCLASCCSLQTDGLVLQIHC